MPNESFIRGVHQSVLARRDRVSHHRRRFRDCRWQRFKRLAEHHLRIKSLNPRSDFRPQRAVLRQLGIAQARRVCKHACMIKASHHVDPGKRTYLWAHVYSRCRCGTLRCEQHGPSVKRHQLKNAPSLTYCGPSDQSHAASARHRHPEPRDCFK